HLEFGVQAGNEDEQLTLRGLLANLNDRPGVAACERGLGVVKPQAPFGFVWAVTLPARALEYGADILGEFDGAGECRRQVLRRRLGQRHRNEECQERDRTQHETIPAGVALSYRKSSTAESPTAGPEICRGASSRPCKRAFTRGQSPATMLYKTL